MLFTEEDITNELFTGALSGFWLESVNVYNQGTAALIMAEFSGSRVAAFWTGGTLTVGATPELPQAKREELESGLQAFFARYAPAYWVCRDCGGWWAAGQGFNAERELCLSCAAKPEVDPAHLCAGESCPACGLRSEGLCWDCSEACDDCGCDYEED